KKQARAARNLPAPSAYFIGGRVGSLRRRIYVKNRFVLVAAAALALAACSRPNSEDRAFQWTGELPAGAVLHFRDGAGDIVVRRAAGQIASVSGSRRWQKS